MSVWQPRSVQNNTKTLLKTFILSLITKYDPFSLRTTNFEVRNPLCARERAKDGWERDNSNTNSKTEFPWSLNHSINCEEASGGTWNFAVTSLWLNICITSFLGCKSRSWPDGLSPSPKNPQNSFYMGNQVVNMNSNFHKTSSSFEGSRFAKVFFCMSRLYIVN